MLKYIQTLIFIVSIAHCAQPIAKTTQTSPLGSYKIQVKESDNSSSNASFDKFGQIIAVPTAAFASTQLSSSGPIHLKAENVAPAELTPINFQADESFKTGDEVQSTNTNTDDTNVENKDPFDFAINKMRNGLNGNLDVSFVNNPKTKQDNVKEFINEQIRTYPKFYLFHKFVEKFTFEHFASPSQSTDDKRVESDKEIQSKFTTAYEKLSKDNWAILKGKMTKDVKDMIALTPEQQKELNKFRHNFDFYPIEDSEISHPDDIKTKFLTEYGPYLKFKIFLDKFRSLHRKDLTLAEHLDNNSSTSNDQDIDREKELVVTELDLNNYLAAIAQQRHMAKLMDEKDEVISNSKNELSALIEAYNKELAQIKSHPTAVDNERIFSLLFDDQKSPESIRDTTSQDTD